MASKNGDSSLIYGKGKKSALDLTFEGKKRTDLPAHF